MRSGRIRGTTAWVRARQSRSSTFSTLKSPQHHAVSIVVGTCTPSRCSSQGEVYESEHRVTVFFGEEAEELFETNWELEVDKFDDMGLYEKVLRDNYVIRFEEPYLTQQ